MFNIYRILYILLHISCAIVFLVKKAWAYIERRYNRAVELLTLETKRRDFLKPKTEAEYLVRSINRIERIKLPKHLVLIIGIESPSISDIVQVIEWSATAGIPCISFYDHNGLLRKRENEARRELLKSKPELVDYIDWNSRCPVKAVKNGINGTKHKMQVQLLSHTDGKREVALLAQSLGKGVITGALKLEEIKAELLEDKLQLGGLPDPDLAIVCGKTCSTYGLLPWHIRTTEFLLLESHHNFKVTEFVHILEKYAKCEQRYGK